MVRGGVVFGKVITVVAATWFPIDDKLLLIASVSDPVETHIHCFGSLLLDGVIDDAVGS